MRRPRGQRLTPSPSMLSDLPSSGLSGPVLESSSALSEEQSFLTGTGSVLDLRLQNRGARVRDLVHGADLPRLHDLELEARSRPGRVAVAPIRFHDEEGARWGEVRLVHRRRPGEPSALVCAVRLLRRRDTLIDLTGNEARFYDARRQAIVPLSNLAGSADALREAEERSGRPSGVTAVLLIDLPGCAALRERSGRAVADTVLARVAERLALVLRPYDDISLVGRDRFAVLFEGLNQLREIERIVGQLYHLATIPVVIDEISYPTAARVGIGADDDGPVGMSSTDKAELALAAAGAKLYGQIEWFRREHLIGAHAAGNLDVDDVDQGPLDLVALA